MGISVTGSAEVGFYVADWLDFAEKYVNVASSNITYIDGLALLC
jgi:hypothetical protein